MSSLKGIVDDIIHADDVGHDPQPSKGIKVSWANNEEITVFAADSATNNNLDESKESSESTEGITVFAADIAATNHFLEIKEPTASTECDKSLSARRIGTPITKFQEWDVILKIILNSKDVGDVIPRGKKEFVCLTFKNGQKKINGRSDFTDDCGVWDAKAQSTKTRYFIISDGKMDYMEKRGMEYGRRLSKTWQPADPQPADENIAVLKQNYNVLKRDSSYKRRISWFDKLPTNPEAENIAVAEYTGEWPTTPSVHGNAKKSSNEYIRATVETKEKIRKLVKDVPPREAYAKLVLSEKDPPHDLKQVQNLKYNLEKNLRRKNQQNRNNVSDDIQYLISEIHESSILQEVITTKEKPPSVILYTDEQIHQLDAAIKLGSVMGVDQTFNLGSCFLTTTVFKNLKLVRKTTQEPPIFVGPMYLHWNKTYMTYQRFFSHLLGKLNCIVESSSLDISNMTVESDEESTLTKALEDTFPGATFVLCSRNLQENMKRKMLDLCVPMRVRNSLFGKIFNKEDGLLSAETEEDFDLRTFNISIQVDRDLPDFSLYFRNMAERLRDNVNRPRKKRYILPVMWTNSNSESMSSVVKITTDKKNQKLPDLIEKLHNIIKLQSAEEKRALYGTGNYELSKPAARFRTTTVVWRSLTEEDKACHYWNFVKYPQPSMGSELQITNTPTRAKRRNSSKLNQDERDASTSTKRLRRA